MDAEQFDGLERSLGQSRSRRQTLRGLAGAGALLKLLAATPVAAGKTGKPNKLGKPNKAPKNPGGGQNGQLGSSQPGTGQNGSPGPSCEEQCFAFDVLRERCGLRCVTNPACRDNCAEACAVTCPPE